MLIRLIKVLNIKPIYIMIFGNAASTNKPHIIIVEVRRIALFGAARMNLILLERYSIFCIFLFCFLAASDHNN